MSKLKQEYLNRTTLTDIILSPLSSEMDWQDIEVVTLTQCARDTATETVMTDIQSLAELNEDYIRERVEQELSKPEYQVARNFVDFSGDKIVIGIMSDKITDDVIRQACDLLIEVSNPEKARYYTSEIHQLDFSCSPNETVV